MSAEKDAFLPIVHEAETPDVRHSHSHLFDFHSSRRMGWHQINEAEPGNWSSARWFSAARASSPGALGLARFESEQPYIAVYAFDQLLRDSYHEEKISIVSAQNRRLASQVAELREQVATCTNLLSTIASKLGLSVESVSTPEAVEENSLSESDAATLVIAAQDVAGGLGWAAKVEYDIANEKLTVRVPVGLSDRVAMSTLDFYVELERCVGHGLMSRISVDFDIVGE